MSTYSSVELFRVDHASAVSDAPHLSVQVDPGAGGARAIQPFEGSRPEGGDYAYSMVLGWVERLRERIPELAKVKAGWVRL
jgi:hypothetical protein